MPGLDGTLGWMGRDKPVGTAAAVRGATLGDCGSPLLPALRDSCAVA
jgi:hypothetical protein